MPEKPDAPKDAETVTAERLALLIEAPETPNVVRDLIQQVCLTIDCHAAEQVEGSDDFNFKLGDPTTPAKVRRHLPKMLRKVGGWRTDGSLLNLYSPDEKGGAS